MSSMINAMAPYFQANRVFHTVTNTVRLTSQTIESVAFLDSGSIEGVKGTLFKTALVAVTVLDLMGACFSNARVQDALNTKYAVYGLLALRGAVVLLSCWGKSDEKKEGFLQALRAGHTGVLILGALEMVAKATTRPIAYAIQGAELATRTFWWVRG